MGLPRTVVIGHAWGVPIEVEVVEIAKRSAAMIGLGSLLVFGGSQRPLTTSLLLSAAAVALVYVHVLLHELGHLVAARREGVTVTEIEVGSLGGSMTFPPPETPGAMFRVAAGGPAASFLMLAGTAMLAALLSGGWGFADLSWSNGLRFPAAATIAEPLVAFLVGMTSVIALNLLPLPGRDGGVLAFAFFWRASGDPRRGARRLSRMLVVPSGVLIAATAAAVLYGETGLPALPFVLLAIALPMLWRDGGTWDPFVDMIELQRWLGTVGVLAVAEERPLTVTTTMTAAEARTRTHASDDEVVLVVDRDGRLAGRLSHETLAGAEPRAIVADLTEELEADDVVHPDATLQAAFPRGELHGGMAIVDAGGFLRGVIDMPKLKVAIERHFPRVVVEIEAVPA